MDFSENAAANIQASQESDNAYARWYASQPDEKKAAMIVSSWQLVAAHVNNQVRENNPFATEADVRMKFIEHTQKEDYPAEIFSFICQKMAERSETEWKQRFKSVKKKLGWTYDDMAIFMGAKSGAAVKASVNRKLPAFAKLAVCVFEKVADASK
jgi:hypothetical protein